MHFCLVLNVDEGLFNLVLWNLERINTLGQFLLKRLTKAGKILTNYYRIF